MKLMLPPRASRSAFDRAVKAFVSAIGQQWVFITDEDRDTYLDAFSLTSGEDHAPSAAVAPKTAEEVQAIVRIANEYKIPLWPISRGKNLAYGGSAPRMSGTVVLDLSRMNQILEMNAEHAYCRLEPGVGFYDLHDYVRKNNVPLWISVPKQAWGSVVGNALERGNGELSYGDHAQQICGMEVVLPTGELIRTGMGARSNSSVWNQFKFSYGPSWDQMFCQSNLGIVTKMGLWLMPEPEASINFKCKVDNADDLTAAVGTIIALRRAGIVDSYMSMVCWLGIAAIFGQREEFYSGAGPIPESVIQGILKKFDIGWWNFDICVYGAAEVAEAKAKIVERHLAANSAIKFTATKWRQGDASPVKVGEPVPNMMPMQFINWYGGRGGHMDFSPVMPASSGVASEYFRKTRAMFDAAGHDYFAALHFGERHIIVPTNIIYNRDDAAMTTRVKGLFSAMLRNASEQGMSEYRTHLSYMDEVAASFDYNNHALLRLNEKIKDAMDPAGILAPGKSGVWPKAYRDQRQ